MCWKYEDNYGKCFDYLFFGEYECYPSINSILEEYYNVDIVDIGKFEREFFNFLSKLHDDNIIKPKNIMENKDES